MSILSSDIFRALSEPIRHRLLQVLLAQELSVSELVEVLDQPQSTVSRHLKVLREADLLVDRRSGPTVYYSARPAQTPGRATGQGDLSGRLLAWLSEEAIEPALRRRLDEVLARRRGGASFFEALGGRWDTLRIEAFGECFHLEALTSLLPREWIVADIGTGTGYLLPVLSSRFARVIAVDPAANMLELARQRPDVQGRVNVEFRAGAFEQLPIEESELDLAIASLVLHHVSEPPAALSEVARTIRPGGKLLLVEQHAHEHQPFHDRMGDVWWGFEPQQVAAWTGAAGFVDVHVSSLGTVRPSGKNLGEVPPLFVVTASKAANTASSELKARS